MKTPFDDIEHLIPPKVPWRPYEREPAQPDDNGRMDPVAEVINVIGPVVVAFGLCFYICFT